MPFTFQKLDIPGVFLVEPKIFPDARGFFAELFKSTDFQAAGIPMAIAQVNQSRSQKNVLRGLHYQLNPAAQVKLVSVTRGEIFDVAVDIRQGSLTFGRWVSARLSEKNKHALYIPEGFAHGFCVMSDEAEIIYYCSREYAPAFDRSILWNDPSINIAWPVQDPILSAKDMSGRRLAEAENNFEFTGVALS
ncbi:MAG: dTDP-4-dehydrorhamnose 3,5-epimerase [Candidatus Omnitrophota bacterium]